MGANALPTYKTDITYDIGRGNFQSYKSTEMKFSLDRKCPRLISESSILSLTVTEESVLNVQLTSGVNDKQ